MATVLRNADGSVVFPSEIPPRLDVPVITPDGEAKELGYPVDQENGDIKSPPQLLDRLQLGSRQLSLLTEDPQALMSEGKRPVGPRTWQSDRLKPSPRPAVTYMKRGGINTSALNQALWTHPEAIGPEEFSSSSSEGEDESPHHKSKRSKAKKRSAGGYHGHHGSNPYRRFNVGNEYFKTKGKVSKKDGRLNITVDETANSGYLAKALGADFLGNTAVSVPVDDQNVVDQNYLDSQHLRSSRAFSEASTAADLPRPKLNIVVMVIGSRGDIQPFLKLGKMLKEDYGHHVRIATHPAFRDFVQKDSGLEFFSVGGDPSELMAFMVKNPGMIPKMETVKAGEIGRRRDQMAEMFQGFWRACINSTDDEHDKANLKMLGEKGPFVADAIIANPPCFAHVHCAERLGVPLHLMFTFPYTPTQTFPHPLANIKRTNVDPGYTNFMSYPLVEMMTWQG